MTTTINRWPGYGDPIVLEVETLVGANLTGANLHGADLTGANLRFADLRGACLTEADLSGAYLRGADLYGAHLRGASLRGASLTYADLIGANLTGADLTDAELTGAKLTGASLTGAHLRGAKINYDTLASLITRAGRSDGYEFLAFRLAGGSTKIKAGCRWLTPDKYKDHIAEEYPDTAKARETLDIIEFIERRAAA